MERKDVVQNKKMHCHCRRIDMDNDFTPEWCQHCNKSSIFAYYERGGRGFIGQRFVQATNDQYFVEFICDQCGRFYAYTIVDVDEVDKSEVD